MTSGVGSIEELSNVVSGSPFQINADANTYAWTGTAGNSTSTETTPEGVLRTNLCTNGSVEAGLTGWSGNDATVTQSDDWSDDGAYSIKVVATGASTQSFATISIPLVSGHTYTVSATIRLEDTLGGSTSSTPRTIRVFDATFAHVNDSPAAPNEESETRLSNTFTAGATNTHLIRLYNGHDAAGATVYWDSVLIEEAASMGEYFDGDSAGYDGAGITAATDGVLLRTNLCTNPSFETNSTSWSATGTGAGTPSVARSTAEHNGGVASLLCSHTNGTDVVANYSITGLTVGQTYTVSGYGKSTGSITFTAGTGVGGYGTPVTPGGAWARETATFTATGTTHTALFKFHQASSSAFSGYLDAVQVEVGSAATVYFSGSATDTDTRLYAWTGTADASTSTETATYTELVSIDTASELDQIVLTRDSNPGTVAVEDPDGRIVVFDPDEHRTIPGPGGQAGASYRVFTDDDYSAIDMEFDMSHIINVLELVYFTQKKPGNPASPKIAHPVPFEDLTSIGKYGRFKPKKPPQIHKKADFADYAAKVFARNADPQEVPRSITIPIIKANDLLPGYEDGHFVGHKVVVWLPDGVTSYTCRVARIQHSITPGKWSVQVFLRDQNIHHHFRTSSLSSEVANNPDGTVLGQHLTDDIDGTGKTISTATWKSSSTVGPGVAGVKLENDTTGGTIKFYGGAASESAGFINSDKDGSNNPRVSIFSGTPSGGAGATVTLTGDPTTPSVTVSGGALQTTGSKDIIASGKLWSDGSYADTTASAANVFFSSDHHIARSTSLRKAKRDIQPMTRTEVESVLFIEPTTFFDAGEVERNGGSTEGLRRIPGVIAEQVEEVAPLFATYDDDGLNGVAYDRMAAAALVHIRQQDERIARLEAIIENLTGEQ